MNQSKDIKATDYLELDDEQLLRQCAVDCYRASGPGGQKRNKTSSAVRIRHLPTELAAIANEDRSQHVNRKRALRRLRLILATKLRTIVDKEKYAISDRLQSCISSGTMLTVGRRDARYPLVIHEILNLLSAHEGSVRDTAQQIGVSTANLIKFFRKNETLWRSVHELRNEYNRKPLK